MRSLVLTRSLYLPNLKCLVHSLLVPKKIKNESRDPDHVSLWIACHL